VCRRREVLCGSIRVRGRGRKLLGLTNIDGRIDRRDHDAGEGDRATVSVVELVTEPKVAVMVTVPNFRLVASPELSIETTVESDDVQVTSAVKSCVVLSL
jgi:hypothetical protein